MTEGLRVNFSTQEASSSARDPLPRGEYHLKITDGEVRFSTSQKHAGKPYWALELTVQDGPYSDRKCWTNVMLFEGALYSLSQLMKALDYDIDEGEFVVPDVEDIITRDVVCRLSIKAATDEYDARNEVKSFKKWDPDAKPAGGMVKSGGSSSKNALLP